MCVLYSLRSWWMSWKKRRGYDDYLQGLIDELKHVDKARDGERLLFEETRKGHLEKHGGVRFRYGEYNIVTMFDEHAEPLIERLKIVNGLGLKSFPVFVEAIKVKGGMFVVTFTPGTKEHDLFDCCDAKPTNESRLKVSYELKKLLANGYFITRYETFTNSYGKIIIPHFFLRKVDEHADELLDAIRDYMEFDSEEWDYITLIEELSHTKQAIGKLK